MDMKKILIDQKAQGGLVAAFIGILVAVIVGVENKGKSFFQLMRSDTCYTRYNHKCITNRHYINNS